MIRISFEASFEGSEGMVILGKTIGHYTLENAFISLLKLYIQFSKLKQNEKSKIILWNTGDVKYFRMYNCMIIQFLYNELFASYPRAHILQLVRN